MNFLIKLIVRILWGCLKGIITTIAGIGSALTNNAWLRVVVIISALAALLTIKHTKVGVFINCVDKTDHINNPIYHKGAIVQHFLPTYGKDKKDK